MALSTHAWLDGAITSLSVTTLQNPGDLGRIFEVRDHSLTVGAGALLSYGTRKQFQIIKRDPADATTWAMGWPIYWCSPTTSGNQFMVTGDENGTLSGRAGLPAGVALGASPAAGKHGFIQVGGIAPFLLKGSPTVAASVTGLPIIGTTTDGEWDTVSTVTGAIAGFCITAKDASVGGGAIGTNMVVGRLINPWNE